MRVLYDHTIFTNQKYGGISRYYYELLKQFNKIEEIDYKVSLLLSNNHYISDKKDINHLKFFTNNKFKGKDRFIIETNNLYRKILLKNKHFDIFHPTYFDIDFLNYIGDKPFVLTVYDMIHEKFKDKFSSDDKTSENKKILCNKANKIIAISENTKKDLISFFAIKESKIEVVYLANSLVNYSSNLNIDLPKKYILFVGSRGGYKNFNQFIKSMRYLLEKDKDLSVVCVGGGTFIEEELLLFDDLNIKLQISHFILEDDKLSFFYNNAELFVFPSLYEGFGLPILESFACQCPLVCSNTSSLSEIAKDAAEYFNPDSIDSIQKSIKYVLDNKERREELILNGKNQLSKFSWEKTAKETLGIYKGIIE